MAALAAVLAVVLTSGGGGSGAEGATDPTGGAAPSGTSTSPNSLPSRPPRAPSDLARDITRAQRIIDDPTSPADALTQAGQFEQLATRELALGSGQLRRGTVMKLSGAAKAAMRADLQAAEALATITAPRKRLPHWRIISPPAANILLGYFKAAQKRLHVPWQDLAAIEFVETKFGRIRGLSTAGAEGPMQFLPATWARYGKGGDVNDPRDAIFAAARLLVANGAPRNMSGALYHYNPSRAYVDAVETYAGRMRADPRAFFGYYQWQVLYHRVGGTVILPVGYPRARPIPLPG
jgi:hypothetical protein